MNRTLRFSLAILLASPFCWGQSTTQQSRRLAVGDIRSRESDSYVDVTRYGVRALIPTAIPATSGITAAIDSGSNTATVSTMSCSLQTNSVCFQNGDGVVIYGAGPSCSLSTTVAPTVTPSVDGGNTGSGFVYPGPIGSTSYQYQVVAVDQRGCVTRASAATAISNGQTLGKQSVSISTLNRSGKIVTVTTASPHALAPGAVISIFQTSDDINFGGWLMVDTVPDNTHFTYTNGIDLTYGNVSLSYLGSHGIGGNGLSAIGGTVTWFNLNRITITPVTGAWEYCVYGRTSGSMNWIGCGKPQGTGGSTITDLTFDDYGSPLMSNFVRPGWLPTTPPGSAQPQYLVSTIVSGAGTTTLTLANNAANSVSGATIRFDDTPNILAAAAAADNPGGGNYMNYMMHFPVAPSYAFYVINSYCKLPQNISISFTTGLYLNATVEPQSGALWTGNVFPQGYSTAGFAQNGGALIYTNEAFPGLYGSPYRYTFRQLNFSAVPSNGAVNIILDTVQPTTFEDCSITSSTSQTNGGMDIPLILRGAAGSSGGGGSSSYVLYFRNLAIGGGGNSFQYTYNNLTPALLCNGCGILRIDNVQLNERGIALAASGAGVLNAKITNGRIQGGANPVVSIIGNGNGAALEFDEYEMDTYWAPAVANLAGAPYAGGQAIGNLTLFNTGCTAANEPELSGRPFRTIQVIGGAYGYNCGLSGQNHDAFIGPVGDTINPFTPINPINSLTSSVRSYSFMHFPGNQRLYFDLQQIPAPTATVSSGGSVPVNTWYFYVSPVGFDGGLGQHSLPSSPCVTTSGNQTCIVTWNAISSAQSYLVSAQNPGTGICAFASVPASTFSVVVNSTPSSVGCLPGDGASGSTYLSRSEIGTPQLRLTSGTTGFSHLQVETANGMTDNRTATWPDRSGFVPTTGYQNSVYDNFNRTNGALGPNWTAVLNAPSVSSNQLTGPHINAFQGAYWSANPFSNDHFSQLQAAIGNTSAVPAVRINPTAKLAYECSGVEISVVNFDNLMIKTLVRGGPAIKAGDEIYLQVEGSQLGCYVNGAQVLTVRDTTIPTGSPGVFVFGNQINNNALSDNWSGGDLHPLSQFDVEETRIQPLHLRGNGGSCTMASGTTCTVTLAQAPSNPDLARCVVTVQGVTPISGACAIAIAGQTATATVTAASSNSATWTVFVF